MSKKWRSFSDNLLFKLRVDSDFPPINSNFYTRDTLRIRSSFCFSRNIEKEICEKLWISKDHRNRRSKLRRRTQGKAKIYSHCSQI